MHAPELQVRFQQEQSREGLQRQLAAMDGQLHILQARLEDSQAENQVSMNWLCMLPWQQTPAGEQDS